MSYACVARDRAGGRAVPVFSASYRASRENVIVASLRLIAGQEESGRHDGEVLACCYTPDGGFVLSAGWDGHLRFWEASSGARLSALRAAPKPVSACAVSPDGKRWLSGSMEGIVAVWDGHTHQLISQSAAHTRPVGTLCYSPDGRFLASASWDRQVSLRPVGKERDTRNFVAHEDIVTGCRFTPDCQSLLTWSHDWTVRLWDVETGKEMARLDQHKEHVTAAGVSPDARWVASGDRGGEFLLWDLEAGSVAGSLNLGKEIRGCFFLLDGATLLLADVAGRLHVASLPDLELQSQLALPKPAQCADLSPAGEQLAVGCDDGVVRFVAVEGCADQPLIVTAVQSTRVTATGLQKLFGRSTTTTVYTCTCPACR